MIEILFFARIVQQIQLITINVNLFSTKGPVYRSFSTKSLGLVSIVVMYVTLQELQKIHSQGQEYHKVHQRWLNILPVSHVIIIMDENYAQVGCSLSPFHFSSNGFVGMM